MSDIIKPVNSNVSRVKNLFAQRAAGTLPKIQGLPTAPVVNEPIGPSALLLDVSASMDRPSEGKRIRRIDALRTLVADMNLAAGQAVYAFSYLAGRCDPANIPEPNGGTDLAKAFDQVKNDGYKRVVLITDGEPDDANEALASAAGLHLKIFYVGSGSKPKFLTQLAKACGGDAKGVTMNKQLASTIRGLLS